MTSKKMVYPGARREDVTDTLTGVSFPDPFRWLEHRTQEVLQWQRLQAKLASAHVREWPHLERLRELVDHFSTDQSGHHVGVVPHYAGGRWFRAQIPAGGTQALAVVADEPMGEGRVLFDPRTENRDRPPFLSWISPSPDGRILALGVCADGSETNTIRLVDVATSTLLSDPPELTVMDSMAQWLADSSGFFFSAIDGTAVDFRQDVHLHLRSPAPATRRMNIPWVEPRDWRWVVVSRDGRHALAFERIQNPIPVAIAALDTNELHWRPFITAADGMVAGHLIADRYFAVTDVGAPRGRLVSIPIDAQNPNDATQWQEIVPESEAVLRTFVPVGHALYLSEFVETYSHIRIVDLEGGDLGDVPLPDRGAVSAEWWNPWLSTLPRGHPGKFLFAFSSLTTSLGIYSHCVGQERVETLQAPQVQVENAVVEDRWAISADGTRIPYHLVRPADVDVSRPQPALIYAYGGFNGPLMPQFPGPMAAFVAAGGYYVHAHLRGGCEFGREWWEGGRLRKKQNCYQDLYAVAEDLIEAKRSSPSLLAVTGLSNGGLLAGVAVTQRPDLWCVAVPRVARLDLIGSCREPYGRMSTLMDRADVDDPQEVRRLATFSPYHLVRDEVAYPAVYLDAGDTDPRCPAWHARKFAARLQRATRGDAPILLHVWENVGHGGATARDVLITQHTEWLAFTMRQLGLNAWAEEQVPAAPAYPTRVAKGHR